MTRLVHQELAGGIATITLDSPSNRNALSTRLLGDLRESLRWALTEPEARVIVLTGAGPVFCSGADLKEQRATRAPAASSDDSAPVPPAGPPAGPRAVSPGVSPGVSPAGSAEASSRDSADAPSGGSTRPSSREWAEAHPGGPADAFASGSGAPITASFPEIMALIWESPKPVICRLNGTARAGGLGLVAACDFAIAPLTASFAFTEVRLGVVPAMIAVPVLRRLAPRAAAEYFLTGEVFDAARAVEIGLLTRAVPGEDLDTTVEHYARMLVKGAPEALAITKLLVREVPAIGFEAGLRRMTALSAERFTSEEGREGIAAFMDKRPPRWVPAGE